LKEVKGFKKNIARHFYDKTFTEYSSVDSTDSEGWTSKTNTEGSTFSGNISYSRLEEVRKEYGIEEQIDATISTHEDIANGTLIKYGSVMYEVVQAIPHDTHNILIIKKWLSE